MVAVERRNAQYCRNASMRYLTTLDTRAPGRHACLAPA
jgi:hypothetical protein